MCSPLKFNWCFGGTYDLHLQGWRISQARSQREPGSKHSWLFAWPILRPWRWRRNVPPKLRLTFNGLHSIVSKKIWLFINIAVRTSKPTVESRPHLHVRSLYNHLNSPHPAPTCDCLPSCLFHFGISSKVLYKFWALLWELHVSSHVILLELITQIIFG
jgi:hypothetical protein